MPHPSRTIVLLPSLLRATASAQVGGRVVVPEQFTSALFLLDVTATNTPTTLDVWIQRGIRNAGATDLEGGTTTGSFVWDDLVNLRATAVSQFTAPFVGSGNKVPAAVVDGALAANTFNSGPGPLGSIWRVKWTVVGTSFTFSVVAQLIP